MRIQRRLMAVFLALILSLSQFVQVFSGSIPEQAENPSVEVTTTALTAVPTETPVATPAVSAAASTEPVHTAEPSQTGAVVLQTPVQTQSTPATTMAAAAPTLEISGSIGTPKGITPSATPTPRLETVSVVQTTALPAENFNTANENTPPAPEAESDDTPAPTATPIPQPPNIPTISSSTHPQNGYSNSTSPSFNFSATVPYGAPPVDQYRYAGSWEDDWTQWNYTSSSSASYTNVCDGEYTLLVQAGNSGGWSSTGTYYFKVDATEPTASHTVSAVAGINGWNKSVSITLTADDPVISGVSSGIKGIHYQISGGSWQFISGSSGSVSLPQGASQRITYYAEDHAGNKDVNRNTDTYKVDGITPNTTASLSGTSGSNGWYRSNVGITLSASDNLSASTDITTNYSYDGVVWYTGKTATIDTEGENEFYYYSGDDAGNAEVTRNQTVKVDKTAPALSITAPVNGTVITETTASTVTVTVQASDTTSGIQYVTINGVAAAGIGSGNYRATIPLSTSGANTITAAAADMAGNTAASAPISVIFDKKPGLSSITTTSDGYHENVTVNCTVSDDIALKTARVIVRAAGKTDKIYNQTIPGNTTSFQINQTVSLYRGENTLIVEAADSSSQSAAPVTSTADWKKRWTVIMYQAGDNSLSGQMGDDLASLTNFGAKEGYDVVGLCDKRGVSNSEAYYLTALKTKVDIPLSQINSSWTNEVNMADYHTLNAFKTYAIDEFPSDHYLLVLSNHGGGWNSLLEDENPSNSSAAKQWMDVTHLSQGLDGQKMDVVYFQTCFSSVMEIAHTIRNNADYMIAHQHTSLLGTDGINDCTNAYVLDVISNYCSGSATASRDASMAIVEKFKEKYQNMAYYKHATLAAMDLGNISTLEGYLNQLVNTILSEDIRFKYHEEISEAKISALKAMSWRPGIPDSERDMADLYDFVYCIQSTIPDSNIQSQTSAILTYLQSSVIINHYQKPTGKENGSHKYNGLGIYMQFPENYDPAYNKYNSIWAEFIKSDITPPKINIESNIAGLKFEKVSDEIGVEYWLNDEYSQTPACGTMVRIVDKNGLVGSAGDELRVLKPWSAVQQITPIELELNAAYLKNGQLYLLPNGEYELQIWARDHEAGLTNGGIKNSVVSKIPFTVNITRKNIPCTVKTPQNPMKQEISVPNALVTFRTQDLSLIVDEGTVNPASKTIQLPIGETLTASVTKTGYAAKTQTVVVNDVNSFTEAGFVPDASGTVDSDGDGIPDGWEYKYWKGWNNPSGKSSCDLSKVDSTEDEDRLYSNESRLTVPGDGLTNLEEYWLQSEFPNLDPCFNDILIEADWVVTNGPNNRSYAPGKVTKDHASQVFMDAGIKVHWSSKGNAIPMDEDITDKRSVKIGDINAAVISHKGSYGSSTGKIIHTVFIPAWARISDMHLGSEKSIGGLYQSNPQLLYVFDLHTRNLVSNEVYTLTPDEVNAIQSDKYEGYILAHECGHVLSLGESQTNEADDIMYHKTSDKTIKLKGDRKFYDAAVAQMDFSPLFQLAGPMTDHIVFSPMIQFTPLAPFQSKTGVMLKARILDLDDEPDLSTNQYSVYYTSNNGANWHKETMILHDDPLITGDEYEFIAQMNIPAALAEGTVVKYYIEAIDGDAHRVTHPKTENLSGPPETLHQFIIDRTPPVISLHNTPEPFSPNGDGIKDTLTLTYGIEDVSNYINQVSKTIEDAAGNVVREWPVTDHFPANSQADLIWDGKDNTGTVVSEGRYVLHISGLDQAENLGTLSSNLQVDLTAPQVKDIVIAPSVYNSVYAQNGEVLDISLSLMENACTSAKIIVTLVPDAAATASVIKTFPVNIAVSDLAKYVPTTFSFINSEIPDDGVYTLKIQTEDAAGNKKEIHPAGTLIVDRTVTGFIFLYAAPKKLFIPEAPHNETVTLHYALTEPAKVAIRITDAYGTVIKEYVSAGLVQNGTYIWDGKDNAAEFVPDGAYVMELTTTDGAGNNYQNSIGVIKNQIPAVIKIPESNAVVGGQVMIKGTAVDPKIEDSVDFDSYKLWVAAGKQALPANPLNPGALWTPIPVPMDYRASSDLNDPNCNVSKRAVMNTLLGIWDTTGLSGVHTILLVVQDKNTVPAYGVAKTTVTVDQSIAAVDAPVLSSLNTSPAAGFVIRTPADQLGISYTLAGKTSDISLNIYQMDETNPSLYKKVVCHKVWKGVATGNKSTSWQDESQWKTIESGTYRIEIIAKDQDEMGISKITKDITVTKNFIKPIKVKDFVILEPVSSTVIAPGTQITLGYELERAAAGGTIKVYDANKNVVANFTFVPSAGPQTATWTPAAVGLYTAELEALAADGSKDSAVLILAVSNGTVVNNAVITYPGTEPVRGISTFRSEAAATGEYYPPQTFDCDVTVHGKVQVHEPQPVNWTVSASAVETYSYQENVTKSGSTYGTDGGEKTNMSDWLGAVPPRLLPPAFILLGGDIHSWDMNWTASFTFNTGSQWVHVNVNYGETYDVAPTPNLNVSGAYGGVEITNLRKDGFTARCYVLKDIRRFRAPLGIWDHEGDWHPASPSGVVFNWSVTGAVTRQGTQTLEGTDQGMLTLTPENVMASGSDTDYSITFQPQHGGTLSGMKAVITDDNNHAGTWVTLSPSGNTLTGTVGANRDVINWTVTARGLRPTAAYTYQKATGTAVVAPSSSVDIPFSLTFTGIVTNIQLVTPVIDFDDSVRITTTLVPGSVTLVGNTLTGILRAENVFVPVQEDWSHTVHLNSATQAQWINTLCIKGHPQESIQLDSLYTVPYGFAGFDAQKYTVSNLSNPKVTVNISGETLTASTGEVDTTWTTLRDTTLTNGILKSGNLTLNANADTQITGDVNVNMFALEGPVSSSNSPFKKPVTLSELYNAGTANSYENAFWWDAATSKVVDNPCVSIDPNSWDITLYYPDGTPNHALTVNPIASDNNNDADESYTVRIDTSPTAPSAKVFVELKGSITDATLVSYGLLYRPWNAAGSLPWKAIPVQAELQVPKTNGVIAYWDVTGLNGKYELKLITLTGSGVGVHEFTATLGTKVTAAGSAIVDVTSPYNKAYLTFPAGSVTADQHVTITPIRLSEADLAIDPEMPLPIGPIFDMKPSGATFQTGKHPTLTVYMEPAELSGMDAGQMTAYHVTGDGKIQPVTMYSRSNINDINGEPIVKFEFDVPGFSRYFLIPEIGIPVFDPMPTKTGTAQFTVTGKADAKAIITIYHGNAVCGETIADSSGHFSMEVLLTEGFNTLYGTATRNISGNKIVGEKSLPLIIELDTDVPEIRYVSAEPEQITPDSDGVDDYTTLSYTLPEECVVYVDIVDAYNQVIRNLTVHGLQGPGQVSVVWDGTTDTHVVAADGKYTYRIFATDMAGNHAQVSGTLFVGKDHTPPVTTLVIGTPRHEESGRIWTGETTPMSFSVVDMSAIRYTEYRIDGGTWKNCTVPFDMSLYSEGEHVVEYRSMDERNNLEAIKSTLVTLDMTAPETAHDISGNQYISKSGLLWVDSHSQFVFDALDGGIIPSGVQKVEYRFDMGSWQTYSGAVSLVGLTEGIHTISYRATDNVDNTESVKCMEFRFFNNLPAGAVNDLAAVPGDHKGEVILQWSTPGEDGYLGNLTPNAVFAVQYSRSGAVIPDVSQAQITIPIISNVVPGTPWIHLISGLEKGQQYTFYVWTKDDRGQWSEVSNKAQSWSMVETEPVEEIVSVDVSGVVGRWSEIALDSKGNVHIAYQKDNQDQSFDIKHVAYDGVGWSTPETVDTGMLGYVGQETGSGISMAVDQNDKLYISYYHRESFQNWNMGTKCAYSADQGKTWTKTEVHYDYNGWYIDKNSSLAVDGNNEIHIAFVSPADNGGYYELYQGKLVGNTWTVNKVVNAGSVMKTNGDCSIAVDDANNPWLSFYNVIEFPNFERNKNLSVLNPNDGSVDVIDDDPNNALDFGIYNDIAVDALNQVHVAYYEAVNKDLKYAKYNGTSWQKYTIDSTGDVGQFASIALDTKGNPFICYYDAAQGDLKYADCSDPSNPVLFTADDAGNVGQYCSMVVDTNDTIHISYYDASNQDLKYYSKTKGGIPEDMIPPATVTGITLESGTAAGEIKVTFTVPADDTGTNHPLDIGSRFAIQYTSGMKDQNDAFWNPTHAQVLLPTCKLVPGTQYSYTLTGLTGGTNYQVRVWAKDNAGWWSIPSDIATGSSQ
ncbi:MAG: clostripain-related cysteine peptidase [Clostridia bacterium]|nr:clostripain-related cysteine peptidase [Clostridia bacterium]